MNIIFYLAGAVAVIASIRAITHSNAVHALLYLIVSLLAVALVFLLMGAAFAAVLEIIVYAGAIMVLFVFVIMMLNLGPESLVHPKRLLQPGVWAGPGLLAALLLAELIYVLTTTATPLGVPGPVGPRTLGQLMFGPYVLGVELASIMLLAGLVGAYHLARPGRETGRPGGGR